MHAVFVLLVIFELTFSQNVSNNSGRKYYFKRGKNSSEVRVQNKFLYLNHNITDYEYPNRRVAFSNVEEKRTTLTPHYLDEEWNYQHKNKSKTNLPRFIQKFYENSGEDQSNMRILFNRNKNNSSKILSFNLDSFGPNKNILDADLYFYWPLENTSSIYRESVVLRLYQFERQFSDDFNESSVQNPDIHKLFNVIYVSKAQKGWQIFKVKKPLGNWLAGEENLGLLLTISSYDENNLIEIFHDTNDGIFSTFVAVKTQNNKYSQIPRSQCLNQFIIQGVICSCSCTLPNDQDYFPSGHSDFIKCQRKEWVVNFRTLGWDQFIISPESIVAHDCAGKCLRSQFEEIHHVKLLHILQKRSLCCVPVKYRSQPIMFFDKFENIAIKNYDNIIVTECGCR